MKEILIASRQLGYVRIKTRGSQHGYEEPVYIARGSTAALDSQIRGVVGRNLFGVASVVRLRRVRKILDLSLNVFIDTFDLFPGSIG